MNIWTYIHSERTSHCPDMIIHQSPPTSFKDKDRKANKRDGFFLFTPQHSRIKGCSWTKRFDLTKVLSTLLVVSVDSLAEVLSIQKTSTGGERSWDPLDLDFLYVSTLQFSNSFLLLPNFPRRCREAEGTALSPRAESDIACPRDFPLLGIGGRKEIIKMSTELRILDFLTLSWTLLSPPHPAQLVGRDV